MLHIGSENNNKDLLSFSPHDNSPSCQQNIPWGRECPVALDLFEKDGWKYCGT